VLFLGKWWSVLSRGNTTGSWVKVVDAHQLDCFYQAVGPISTATTDETPTNKKSGIADQQD
jgi:hypothetical protein